LSRSPHWRTLTVSELRFHSVNSDRLEGGSQKDEVSMRSLGGDEPRTRR
jgi:hypothetical protein